MATCNGEKYIQEQIESLLNQSLQPSKIIVVDDSSADSTPSAILKYHKKYPDLIVFEQNERNLGHKKAFERGITLCDADYIALCDQDDIWQPDKLQRCYHALEENLDAKLCFHDLALIDESGNPLGKSYWESAVIPLPISGAEARNQLVTSNNFVPGCTMFFSSDLKEYIVPMPDSKWSLHDWWIAVVAFFLANPIIVRQPLTWYRLHNDQACSLALNIERKRKKHSLKTVPFKIMREARRLVLRRRRARMRLQDKKERERALSQDVLRVISMYEALNFNHIPEEELPYLREILKSNIHG